MVFMITNGVLTASICSSYRTGMEMRKKKFPVTFIVYPDEGRRFGRIENILDFFGRFEEFLARYIGGRCEPWKKIEGLSAQLK